MHNYQEIIFSYKKSSHLGTSTVGKIKGNQPMTALKKRRAIIEERGREAILFGYYSVLGYYSQVKKYSVSH